MLSDHHFTEEDLVQGVMFLSIQHVKRRQPDLCAKETSGIVWSLLTVGDGVPEDALSPPISAALSGIASDDLLVSLESSRTGS